MAYEKSDNAINTKFSRSAELYDKFKRAAARHFVPLKMAMREAMRIWMESEMGDREFARYDSLHKSYNEMREKVKLLLEAEDLEDLEAKINAIVEQF